MKKSAIIFLFLISIIFLFTACVNDSPLSDTEFSDPSLISPEIIIKKSISSNGTVTSNIQVWLLDKNINSVELKNGDVRCNGVSMSLQRTGITNAPYYSVNPANVMLNKEYNFEIQLSDGEIYKGNVATPDKDLYELNLPQNYSKQTDMPISWKDTYSYNEMEISNLYSFKDDTSGGVGSTEPIKLSQSEMAAGTYTIPKSQFYGKQGIYETTISISGTKYGSIDEKFGSRRKIYSIFSVSKTTHVND